MNFCRDRIKALCDLEILTGNDNDPPVLANSLFLYGVSEKWNELVSRSADTKTILIPQISRETMENIMTYIYSEDRNLQLLLIDDGNVGKYCQAANFLQMNDIKDHCLNFLASKSITMDNYFAFFELYRGNDAIIELRMRTFFTQNAQQIPDIVRSCKNELKMSESEISRLIIDWISASGGKICGLDMEKVIQEFSNKEKRNLCKAFVDVGDLEMCKKACHILLNLCQSGGDTLNSDSNSNSHQHHDQNQNQGRTSTRTDGNQRPQISEASTTSTSSSASSSSSLNKRRRVDSSADSIPNLEQNNNLDLDSSFEWQEMESDNNSNRSGQRRQSTSSSCSSPPPLELQAPPSSSLSPPSSTTERELVNSPQGIVYFLLKKRNVLGGNCFWSFNLNTKEFGHEAKMPPSFQDRRKLAMIYWKDEIYFMGGESSRTGEKTKEVLVFNLIPNGRKWTKMEMVDPRCDFQACVLNGDIYAVGGCEENPDDPKEPGDGINTVEMLSFDPVASTDGDLSSRAEWKQVDFMENCRADAGIVSLGGNIYAIGGFVGTEASKWNMRARNLCEVFDPTIPESQNQWNPIAPMEFKRMGLAAVATTNPNRIYALGGTLKSPCSKNTKLNPDPMKTVEIYDPDEDTWTTGPPMQKSRKFFSAVFYNNCIYALGGDSDTDPTVEKFDLGTNKWKLEAYLKKEGSFSTVAFK